MSTTPESEARGAGRKGLTAGEKYSEPTRSVLFLDNRRGRRARAKALKAQARAKR